mgnify:FL=1
MVDILEEKQKIKDGAVAEEPQAQQTVQPSEAAPAVPSPAVPSPAVAEEAPAVAEEAPAVAEEAPPVEEPAKTIDTSAPVILASPIPTSISSAVSRRINRKSYEQLLKEDVAAQRAGREPNDVMDEIVASGKAQRFGDTIVSAQMIEEARSSENKEALLDIRGAIFSVVGSQGDGVVLPDVRQGQPYLSETVQEEYHGSVPKFKNRALARIYIDKKLEEDGVDELVRQTIAEEFVYGNVGTAFARRIQGATRGLSMFPKYIISDFPSAIAAGYRSGTANVFSDEYQAEFDAAKPARAARTATYNEMVSSPLGGADSVPGKILSFGVSGLTLIPQFISGFDQTMAEELNGDIHDSLEERFAKTNPDLYAQKAFEIDSQTGEFLLDTEGQRIKRKFITEANAEFMTDLAFETLSGIERGAAIVAEEVTFNVATGGGFTLARGAGRIKTLMKLKKNPKYADLLKDIDDPEDILNAAGNAVNFTKADKYFQAGLLQYRTNQSMSSLSKSIKETQNKVIALQSKKEALTLDEMRELAQSKVSLRQAKDTKNMAFTRGRFVPYVKDSIEGGAVVGIAASVFRENPVFFEDANTAELVSLMAMSFGGYKLATPATQILGGGTVGAAKATLRKLEYVAPGIPEITAGMVRHIPVVGSFLVDKTRKNIEDYLRASNIPVDAEVKRNIEVLVGAFAKFDPRTRREAFAAMEDGNATYEKLVNGFEPGAKREEAKKLFFQNFAQSSNLLSLMAVGALNKLEVDISSITGKDIERLEQNLRETTRLTRAATLGLDRFMEMAGQTDDIEVRNNIINWVETRKKAYTTMQIKNSDTRAAELKALGDMENYLIRTGRFYSDKEMRLNLARLRTSLQDSLGETLSEKEALDLLDKKVRDDVSATVDAIQDYRGKPKASVLANRALEIILQSQMGRIFTNGRAPYKAAEEYAANSTVAVDLNPVFEKLIEQDDYVGIRKYFGPKAEMFNGATGKLALEAFTDMRRRAMPDETLDALRKQFVEANMKDSTQGMSKAEVDALSDHGFFLEVLRRNKVAGGTDFSPFRVANVYETELMARAFESAADRAERSGRNDVARELREFVDSINNTVKNQDPEFSKLIEGARANWRRTYGESLEEGSILANFEDAKLRQLSAETIAEAQGGGRAGMETSFLYKTDSQPIEIAAALADNFVEFLRPGGSKSVLAPTITMDRLIMSMGSVLPGTRVKGFDLTDPKQNEQFLQLREIFGTLVAEATSDKVLDSFKSVKAKTGPRYTTVGGAFDFEAIGDMDELTATLKVPVIRTKGGPVEYESFLDVVEIYSAQKSLQRAVDNSDEVAEGFINLKSSFSRQKEDATSELNKRLEADERELEDFAELTDTFNGKEFYEKFITSGEGGSLEKLKEGVVEAYLQAYQGMTRPEAEALFNKTATTYIFSGMLESAGVSAVKGRVPGGDSKLVYQEFQSPQALLEILTDDATRATLETIMTPSHIEFLTDITRYVNDSHLSVKVAKPSGITRMMGFSSIMSRGWNLARRVVSPVYVAADYMFTAARAGQVEVLKLAIADETAAKVILAMFQPMEVMVTPSDLSKFEDLSRTFIFTELARTGQSMDLIDTGEKEQIRETAIDFRKERDKLLEGQ